MDRRSWLWRRKASDKSSGETESLGSGSGSGSGSVSSPSERFSDEQQVYSIQNTHSPEVTSNHSEDTHDSLKILSQKLSAAVATINEKEELVKQHAKVAEEAVTGWEKAENEMNALNQQLDAATKKNSTLEDKVVHLDGALKECLRQLRQVREEQDQKILEATGKKAGSTESTNSELQGQLADISTQLEISKTKAEAAEKENASLQLQLHSLLEELEMMTLERDLSTKRAETASKQHLESIKKVAKLESECRGLKAMARKGALFNDNRSANGKLDYSRSHMSSSSNSGFMDDFLEMEKLVAQPMQESRRSSLGYVVSTEKSNESGNDNATLKGELEVMINRTAELEEKIEMVEAEKVELGLSLSQCQDKLQLSESSFRQLQAQFDECQNQLRMSQAELKDANKKIGVLQAELDLTGELRQAIDLELDDANVRREDAESRCKALENESRTLQSKVDALEDKLSRMESDAVTWQNQLGSMKESKEEVERKFKGITGKKETVESELKAVQTEVKSLLAKIGSLENESEKERRLSAELDAKCRKLEGELSRTKNDGGKEKRLSKEFDAKFRKLESELSITKNEADMRQNQLTTVTDLKEGIARELQMVKTRKEEVERKLKTVQGEAKSLLARVSSLEHEMDKERKLSADFAAKCRKLEDELSKVKCEVGIRFAPLSKEELNKQQEKEIAVAANKLAECQKTIASLGNQIKSLASLEDLFLDSDDQLNISDKDPQLLKTDVNPASVHSSSMLRGQFDSVSSETGNRNSSSVSMKDDQEIAKAAKQKEGLSTFVEKSRKNSFDKIFSRSRSAVRTRN